MKKQALIIGRFQPLCQNHVELFHKGYDLAEEVIIGVGQPDFELAEKKLSAHEFSLYQLNHMFSFERIKEWINKSLGEKPHTVVPVKDIFDHSKYEQHVIETFNQQGKNIDDAVLFGENPGTYNCFSQLESKMAIGVSAFHATDARKEILETGHSDLLSSDLNSYDLQQIVMNETIKERLGNTGILRHNGHVKLTQEVHENRLYDVVVMPDACAIMYIDDKDNVWFANQYRQPMRRELLELPAETIDKPGKSPLTHAVEGLEEEMGIKVSEDQIKYVTTLGSSEGHDTENVHLFTASGEYELVGQRLEDGEKIRVERIPFAQAYNMMKEGKIRGSKTAFLLQHEYIKRLENGGL